MIAVLVTLRGSGTESDPEPRFSRRRQQVRCTPCCAAGTGPVLPSCEELKERGRSAYDSPPVQPLYSTVAVTRWT
jgi:hypothetical protein